MASPPLPDDVHSVSDTDTVTSSFMRSIFVQKHGRVYLDFGHHGIYVQSARLELLTLI
jgi:hypothetical protein